MRRVRCSLSLARGVRSRNGAGFPLATRTRDGGRRGPCMCSGLEIHVPGRGTYSVRTCRSLENQPGHNPQLGKPHRCRMRRCHFRKLLGASTKIYSLVDTPRRSHVISPLSLSSFFHAAACMHARLCTSCLTGACGTLTRPLARPCLPAPATVKLDCVTFIALRLPPGVTCGKKSEGATDA
jgi:hypothetical protein